MTQRATIHHGDALDVLPLIADDSIDAVVTDPPYELGFMGRAWDASGIAYNVELWKQCYRALKPGGHLLAFGGTRTAHRLAVAVEDAGFEIRDSIIWLYGSGFPKSLDVSKAIDKAQRRDFVLAAVRLGLDVPGNNLHDWTKAEHSPGDAWWERFKSHLPVEDWQRIEREVTGQRTRKATGRLAQGDGGYAFGEDFTDTVPATDDAKRWAGWGTALKPAHEPIVVARKPLVGTVTANVLAHGTGALNIDACRVETSGGRPLRLSDRGTGNNTYGDGLHGSYAAGATDTGRWPANIVLSHAGNDVDGDLCADGCIPGCPVRELDEQSGMLKSGANPTRGSSDKFRDAYGEFAGQAECTPARGVDVGGASRFFPVFRYQAKAPTKERPKIDGVAHPTVKPLELMRWLVRLVTQLDGLVLDPFAGSGTTAEACALEGMRCVTIEREADYLKLINARLAKHQPASPPPPQTPQEWLAHFGITS